MTHDWDFRGDFVTVEGMTTMDDAFISPSNKLIFPDTITMEFSTKCLYDEDTYYDIADETGMLSFNEETNTWTDHIACGTSFYCPDMNTGIPQAKSTNINSNVRSVYCDQLVPVYIELGGAHLTVFKQDAPYGNPWGKTEQSVNEAAARTYNSGTNYDDDFSTTADPDYYGGYYHLEKIPYVVAIMNDGEYPLTDLLIKDDLMSAKWVLRDALNYYDLECGDEGILMPGEYAVFSTHYFVKQVDEDRGYIDNTAYVANWRVVDDAAEVPDNAPSATCRVTVLPDYDHLDVVKEIVDEKPSYKAGDTIEYKVTVTNNTDHDVSTVQFTDYCNRQGLQSGTVDGVPFEWTEYDPYIWNRPSRSAEAGPMLDPLAAENASPARMAIGDRNELYNEDLFAVVLGDMHPGDSHVITSTYTLTAEDIISGNIYNSARATGMIYDYEFEGYDYTGDYLIEGWNDKLVEFDAASAITVKKEPVGHSDDYVYAVGETARYKVTVSNTGTVDLYGVCVLDSDKDFNVIAAEDAYEEYEDGIGFEIGYLAPGESASFERSLTVTEYEVGHVFDGEVFAIAELIDPKETIREGWDIEDYYQYAHLLWPNLSFEVFDTDDWSCAVENMKMPALSVNAVPAGTIKPGSDATFEITVENTSNVTVENIKAADEHGHSIEVGTLAPGEKKTVQITDKVDGQYSNTVTATGATPERRTGGNETVTASDDMAADVRTDEGTLVLKLASVDDEPVTGAHLFDICREDGTKVAAVEVNGGESNSVALPIGRYIIKHNDIETGYVKAADVPFELALDEAVPWNKPVVEKTINLDKQTGSLTVSGNFDGADVPSALYTVKDADGNIVAENANAGIFGELLPGIYTVSVAKSPEGFKTVGDTEKTVEIKTDESGRPVISETVSFDFTPNEGVKTGTLIIQSSTGTEADETNTLSGAQYDLFADADIIDADGNILYHKGDKVDTILGENLKEVRIVIPVGTYRLVEVKSPDGFEPSAEPEKIFDIGEAELIITYVNTPSPTAPAPTPEPDLPISGGDMENVPAAVENTGVVSQTGDNIMAVAFTALAVVCIGIGVIALRRKSE